MLKNGIDEGTNKKYLTTYSLYKSLVDAPSFQSIMNFIELRDEPTSQVEIQDYVARGLKEIMLEVFPETTKLWSEIYLD